MLSISIPGAAPLQLFHLVLDYNGTIALDGSLSAAAAARISRLAEGLDVHVITADTHGTVASELNGLPCRLTVIAPAGQDLAKVAYIENLGLDGVVAIGNGRNDALMLRWAALGIGLISAEGASAETIRQADIICTRIEDALDLLLVPDRLRATLRN